MLIGVIIILVIFTCLVGIGCIPVCQALYQDFQSWQSRKQHQKQKEQEWQAKKYAIEWGLHRPTSKVESR